jgi:hypothetical protein
MDGMMERGWGRVINISSVNGTKGAFGQTNYAAAKAGMHGFTKALALEVAKKGVTVNTISPGYIGTKMVMASPQEVLDSKILPQIPQSRLGKPEEVAGLVAYLSSDEAAFVTGANISINGGVLETRWSTGISRAQGTGAGQIQIIGGVSGLSGAGSGSGATTHNIGAITWGSATFNPTEFVFQSSNSGGGTTTLSSAINLNGGALAFSGIEIGSGGIKALKLELDGDKVFVSDYADIQHSKVLSTPGVEVNDALRVSLGALVSATPRMRMWARSRISASNSR